MSQATFYWTQGLGTQQGTGDDTTPEIIVPPVVSGAPNSTLFNDMNFISIDSWSWDGYDSASPVAGHVDYTDYPVRIISGNTNYSYEKWIRAYFEFVTGITNKINNVHIYRANSNGMNDEALSVFAACQRTFLTPIGGSKRSGGAGSYQILYYDVSIWSGPTQANDAGGVIGAASGNTKVNLQNISDRTELTESGWSDWIVFQLCVPDSVNSPGAIGSLTWRMQYDEQ